jgi:hypothetical protein
MCCSYFARLHQIAENEMWGTDFETLNLEIPGIFYDVGRAYGGVERKNERRQKLWKVHTRTHTHIRSN